MLKNFAQKRPVLFGGVSALTIGVLFWLIPSLKLDKYTYEGFSDIIMQLIYAVLAIICVGILFQTNGLKYTFGIKRFGKGLIAAIPIILLIVFRMIHLSLMATINTRFMFLLLPKALFAYIVAAVFEESASRGLFMGGMLQKWSRCIWGRIAMIVISGAVFGIMHLPSFFNMALSDTVYSIIQLTFIGMGFGAVYLFSKNLLPGIVIHAAMNILMDPITKMYEYGIPRGDYKLNYMRDVFLPKVPNIMIYIVIPVFAIVMAILSKPYMHDNERTAID